MRLEQVPFILGGVVALVGLLLILDGAIPDRRGPTRERRRRIRRERDRLGEVLVGLGAMAMAAAFIGRDTWLYGTVAVLAGATLLGIGVALNWHYVRELVLFRGAARRGEKRTKPRAETAAPAPVVPDVPATATRTPARTIELERPITASGFADRPPPAPDDGDPQTAEARPRRPRIR